MNSTLLTRVMVAHDRMHIARRDEDSDREWECMQIVDVLLDVYVCDLKAAGRLPALDPVWDKHLTVVEKPKLVRLSQVRAQRRTVLT